MKYAFDRVVLLNVWGLLVLLVWNEATRPAPEAIVRVDTVTVYIERSGPIAIQRDTVPVTDEGKTNWTWCPSEEDACYFFDGDSGKCYFDGNEMPCDSLIKKNTSES